MTKRRTLLASIRTCPRCRRSLPTATDWSVYGARKRFKRACNECLGIGVARRKKHLHERFRDEPITEALK